MSDRQPILITLKNAVGDTIVLTGAIRDLALQFRDRYRISVATHAGSIWENNPHIEPSVPESTVVALNYANEMRTANNGARIHFLLAFHKLLSQKLGIDLRPTTPRPDLHLRADEHGPRVGSGYWVIFPGWKNDMPAKAWNQVYWQQLIDILASWGIHCVQVGEGPHNPQLARVTSLVGMTNRRQLLALIRDSCGVICGITMGMHAAAALEKPCVVIAGGREAWWWEAYTNENDGFRDVAGRLRVPHRFLHTIGLLPCCPQRGCHKSAVVVSRRHNARQTCSDVVSTHSQKTPHCMAMITPQMVCDAVLSYYIDHTIAPHSPTLIELAAKMPALPAINEPLSFLRADGAQVTITTAHAEIPDATPETVELAAAPTLPAVERPAAAPSALDHPALGGRITLCVLLYGDFHELHRRCLDNILRTTPRERVELRVGCNSVCGDTLRYLEELRQSGDIFHVDMSDDNRGKYPVMRAMFRTPPLTTKWLIWFDDDTICDRRDDWLELLAQAVVARQANNCRVLGPLYRYRLSGSWQRWLAQAPWYRHKPWDVLHGQTFVQFPTGSCWAAECETVLACDIPDARLGHNKGDVTIGCQFHQHGHRIWSFTQQKDVINWSAVPRRGLTTIHPAEG